MPSPKIPVRKRSCTDAMLLSLPRCLVPDTRRSLARAGIKDYSKLPGVQTYSHGPYLDDWSKVPADIAAKYNTSPTPSFAGK
jgi:hypothetical protein